MIGDAILDEYCYVTPLGMAAKESIIAAKARHSEVFYGGVFAAANHLTGFCSTVDTCSGRKITTKKRFVEETYTRKLFEVHSEQDDPLQYTRPDNYAGFDLVVAADFGHGCITNEMIGKLTDEARYLAINAQTNSANRGFNLITKYPRADYVVIDSLEARLATHDRDSPIETVIQKLGFPRMIITQGVHGAVGFDGEFHYSKALTSKVVDTMGAGDAFFCVTAPFAAAGASMPELLEIGNAAGAIKCGSVGQVAVTREALCRIIEG